MTVSFPIILVGIAVTGLVWLVLPAGKSFTSLSEAHFSKNLRFRGLFTTAKTTSQSHSAELVVAEVAALLRAGVPPGAAWRRATGVAVDGLGLPDKVGLTLAVGADAAAALSAASGLALRVGAPLAVVLQTVGAALQTENQAQADRQAALAGPQTTARVLLALPLLGLLLGMVLGANPIQIMFGGGLGTLSFLGGAGLLLLGRWWIARLVSAAAGQMGA